jgi:hypothetical protein
MAVYQYGSNPQAWATPLASGILEYRKQVAAEQEAARKAAEKAQREAKAAMKEAKKENDKLKYERQKIARDAEGVDLVKRMRGDADAVESELGEFFHAQPGGSGSGSKQNYDLHQMYQRARERAYEIGMDPESGRKGDITRFNTQKRRAATQDRFMGRDQMPVGSDRYKKYTYDQEQAFDKREEKRKEDLAKLAKKGGGTGTTTKGTRDAYKAYEKYRLSSSTRKPVRDPITGEIIMTDVRLNRHIPGDEFSGLTGKTLGFDPDPIGDRNLSQLLKDNPALRNDILYSDLDRAQFVEQRAAEEATVAANEQRGIIANADMQDEIRQEAKDKLAARLAEAEMQAANEAAAIKNEAEAIKASKTSFGKEAALANRAGWNNRFYKNIETIPSVADSGQSRKMPLALRNLIRSKTYTEQVAPENKYEMSPDFPWRGRLAQPTRVQHVPSQERIDAMTALVADTALQRTSGDAVARAAHVISGYTGGEQLVIQDQINELVLKGEATLVELKGHGENMTAVAVTADGLLDQLRDQIPGFIDGGPKPITDYNGVLVEYHPEIDKHFILQKIGGF